MASGKPTYEQLAQRVKELEKKFSYRPSDDSEFDGYLDPLNHSTPIDEDFSSQKESIERLKTTILNSLSDIVSFHPSPDMKPAWMNQALLDATGYAKKALLSMTCHQCWFKTDTPCSFCPVLKTFNTGKAHESQAQTLDGRFWYIRSFPTYNEKGDFEGVVKVVQDITERKIAERAFSEKRETYRMLFHSTPVGICSYDKEGRIIECNQTCADIMGTTVERLLAFNTLKDPADKNLIKAVADSLDGRKTHFEGFYTSTTGGRRSFLNVDFAPTYSIDNQIIGGIAVGVDAIEQVSAEIAFQESEVKYRGILNNIEDGYYEVDLHGNLTFFNDSLCEILGYPRSELMGMNYRSFMLVEDIDLVFKTFNRVFTTGNGAKGCDWRIIRKDGSVRYLDTSVSLVGDAQGNISNFGGITRDVTERRQAEAALRISEEQYHSLFEGIPVGLYQTTLNGKIIDANEACLKIFHCPSKDELRIHDARKSYVNREEGDLFRRQLVKRGHINNYETRLWRWDGSIAWVSITAHVIYDDFGNISGIEGSVKDISDRKEQEKQLQESEAKFRGLAERCSDIVVLFDNNGKPLYWSPSSERILGYSKDELMGKRPEDLMGIEDYAKMLEYISRIAGKQEVGNLDGRMSKKDGTEITIEWMATPVYHGENLTGIQFIGRDITVRKNAEEALRRSSDELRNLAKHLESAREQERMTIAREVHDDLGQALTAIKFDLSWIRRHLPDRDVNSLVDKVETTTKIVNEAIQSVKRISSQLRPAILNDLGLEAAIEWYLDDFRKRTGLDCRSSIQRGIFAGDGICEEICISIFRIFQEALTNVARHARATEVFVKLEKSDGRIEFEVNDNGIGINEMTINQDESFGLLGMRERVNAFGGELFISGSSGKGTSLKVNLPIIRTDESLAKV